MTQISQISLDDVLDQVVLEYVAPSPQLLKELLLRYPEHRAAIITFVTTWSKQQLLPAAAAAGSQVEEATVQRACARFEAAAAARDVARHAESAPQAKVLTSPLPQTLSGLAQRAGVVLVDLAVPSNWMKG